MRTETIISNGPQRWTRKLDALALFAFAAIYLSSACLILFRGPKEWVTLITDDGYYYLGIIRSLVDSGSSSFLPPFHTNGYQPLWLLPLGITALLFGTSDTSLVLQLYSLSFAFTALFAWLAKRHYGMMFPALLAAVIFFGVSIQGMETSMMPAFVVLFFTARRWQSRGILSALIFLTRLDAVALVVVRDLYFLVTKKQRDFRHYLILLPVAAAYFLLNYRFFGSAVPVSGLAKAIGFVPGENLTLLLAYVGQLKYASMLLVGMLISSIFLGTKVVFRFRDEIIILLVSYFAICAYFVTRSGWLVWPWYYWPAMLLFFYMAMEWVGLFIRHAAEPAGVKKPAMALAMLGFALVLTDPLLMTFYYVRPTMAALIRFKEPTPGWGTRNIELVNWIRQNHVPKGTYFAMGDRAGSFGFFLGPDYRFLHTEGLVGSYDYYRALKSKAGAEFVRNQHVDYLIADRGRFIESGGIIGVIEPVQPMSSRHGQFMMCFDKRAIVIDQGYMRGDVVNSRYMFRVNDEIACPTDIVSRFGELRDQYGAIRRFTVYDEYPVKRKWYTAAVQKYFVMPPYW